MINHILPKDVPTSKKDENNEHVQQKCQSSKFSGPDYIKEFKNKQDILKGFFTNPEFPKHSDNSIEFSEHKPDIVLSCNILQDSPILEQFEYLLKEQ